MFGRKSKNQRRSLADQNSKKVYTYYSNTRLRDEQPDRSRLSNVKDRLPKPKTWWHHTPSILALVAIVICLGYSLSINTNPKIIQITDNQGIFLRSKNTYQAAANKIIKGSLLNYNKVTINVAEISNKLKQQFPELSDVSVTIPLVNRRPIVYIAASQPAMLLMANNGSYVVDNRGVVILPSAQIKSQTKYNLPVIKDNSNLEVKIGQPILTAANVKFITDITKQMTLSGQPIDQLTLPAVANEFDVRLKGQNYYIKMDMTGNSGEESGAYLASIAKISSLHSTIGQYIDVRVPGRVFYK